MLAQCSTFAPPSDDSFLYFLVKESEIIYIGETVNVHSRAREHWRSGKDFDYAMYFPTPLNTYERRDLEKHLITRFQPKLNDARQFRQVYWPRTRRVRAYMQELGCSLNVEATDGERLPNRYKPRSGKDSQPNGR